MSNADLDKVIHKINSFVAVIYGYSQLIQDNPSDPEQVKKWNQKILDVSKQLQEYVNSLDKNA